jgi:DHA1 family multidrug resistance protein-like MFS transporter
VEDLQAPIDIYPATPVVIHGMRLLDNDTFWGQLVYLLSRRRLLRYPEEEPGFVPPTFGDFGVEAVEDRDLEQLENAKRQCVDSDDYLPSSDTFESDKGMIYVSWYGPNDAANPKNWSLLKKIITGLQMGLLVGCIYMGSSIYMPAILQLEAEFHIPEVVAILPLAVFVFGYGVGQTLFSPLSEHPRLGRMWIYNLTLLVFWVLQAPTAKAKNIASLTVLRFICGVLAAPSLSMGAATMGDMFEMRYMTYAIASWAFFCCTGPALGPLLGGVFYFIKDWRWTFWILGMVSCGGFIILSLTLPETYAPNILHRRAARLRKLTGNPNYTTIYDEEYAQLSVSQLAREFMLRPFEIAFTEPIVLALDVYIAMLYATLYVWFEAFPLVFHQIHHFNAIQSGLAYMGLMVGGLLGLVAYCFTTYWAFEKRDADIETFMKLCLIGAVCYPVSVFIFGWTSHPDIHWIAPIIASGLNMFGAFFIFQTSFNYLGGSFPRFMASVFAGNGLFRASFAGAFPLFSKALFVNLQTDPKWPVAWGCTLLGCIGVLMIIIPVLLIIYGGRLKGRSKYTGQ